MASVTSTEQTCLSTSRHAFVGRAHHEAIASRIASTHLERIGGEDLVPGESPIEVGEQLPEASATRHVARVEPGLYRVKVQVRWSEGLDHREAVTLTTFVAREESK